jgi:hypothetical protein
MVYTDTECMNKDCCVDVNQDCTGKDCMSWRWYDPLVDPASGKPEPKSRRGYCGLAGKPEYEE